MSKADLVRTLCTELLADRQHLHAINAILSAQRQAILTYAQSELDELNQQLMQHYRQLHQHARQRIAGLQQLGLPAAPQGMTQLLAELPEAARQPLQSAWQEMTERLQHCQQANSHNQQLIEMQYDILQNSLPATGEELSWLYQPGPHA